MLTMPEAIDTFIASFSYTRSFTHPTEVIEQDCLRIIRDLPRKSGIPRREEVMVPPGAESANVLDSLTKYVAESNPRYMLCVFAREQDIPEVKTAYKQNGYRLLATEPVMVADLNKVTTEEQRHQVRRVTTWEEVNAVAKLSRARMLRKEDISRSDTPVRLYYIETEGDVVAYGRNVTPQKNASYVGGLMTAETSRRQGMGSAILRKIFAEDQARGIDYSVLLASKVGSLLYTSIGYELLGSLLMFTKDNRIPGA